MLLDDTGIRKALGFLDWFAFDLPRTTTGIGVALLAGQVAVHLWLLFGDIAWPVWLTCYYGVLIIGWAAAAVPMVFGSRVATAQAGWFLGDLVSIVFLVIYVVSRITGLPGAPYLKGWWDFPAGTFGMVFALGFIGLHLSILFGVMVARPQRRNWRY